MIWFWAVIILFPTYNHQGQSTILYSRLQKDYRPHPGVLGFSATHNLLASFLLVAPSVIPGDKLRYWSRSDWQVEGRGLGKSPCNFILRYPFPEWVGGRRLVSRAMGAIFPNGRVGDSFPGLIYLRGLTSYSCYATRILSTYLPAEVTGLF